MSNSDCGSQNIIMGEASKQKRKVDTQKQQAMYTLIEMYSTMKSARRNSIT